MVPSGIALPAAAWLSLLLANTASAFPKHAHAAVVVPRQQTQTAANPTDAWVSVDPSGVPKTITPVLTTISGTPTIISGAPYEVTGTVFTQTRADAKITTSTGAAQPQATGSDGSGSFAACQNRDGDSAPFCEPKNNASIYPGATHYVTWDPAFFNTTNTTVRLVGFYNETDEAFSSDLMAAGWGFYQWQVKPDLYTSRHKSAVNITFRIAALPVGSSAKWFAGPTVLVGPSPTPLQPPTQLPSGAALYIALPTVLGFVAVMVVGTCWWNRHHRRIGLGNVMGRGRGGYGVGKSRRQRLFGKGNGKKEGIRLMEREVGGGDEQEEERRGRTTYRDEPSPAAVGGNGDAGGWTREIPGRVDDGLGRRDSDALGSLAGTPTQDRRFEFGRGGDKGGNAFRDELDRQAKERF
ncbi:hypothetical protein QBC47DRAFT_375772 [Echria macrotheca]|uniref:Uncharacterized protein n=1 Tax=Echria macrotheca TaxID=438768 RepID=A0AAJ0BI97_9PEZI|nr:hypothetical protein QBC47DRAFT_375772 [Echria macrotheca]